MSNGPITPDVVPTTPVVSLTRDFEECDTSPIIPRSASHTQLAEESVSVAEPATTLGIHRSFSENILATTPGDLSRKHSKKQLLETTGRTGRALRNLGSINRRAPQAESEPHFAVSKFVVGPDQASEDVAYDLSISEHSRMPDRGLKSRSVSGSFTNFARKSWGSTSRSPSPSPNKRSSHKDTIPGGKLGVNHSRPINEVAGPPDSVARTPVNGNSRRNSILSKRPRRPASSLWSQSPGNLDTPSMPPIPKSFSTDKLPSSDHRNSAVSNPPALPKSQSSGRLQSVGVEAPRKKDELWSVFRNLDGEYLKFQARPSTLKTPIIRSALLPFLRSYAEHPSISSLRPEDIDRRTVILNKWWTGLLEMLNGRHGESVSGNDRPAVLEAVTALMIRPEWVLPPQAVTLRPSKTSRASLKSRSTTSLVSTMTMSSDFLAESIYHNVKNNFTQNLLAQMAYVVDKMSMRSVAASVVSFCGKATAYAFFYCEGVAEILVRLWAIPAETIRRVLAEEKVLRDTKLEAISDRICTMFPACLHSLSFRSFRGTVGYLRRRPHVPIATAYIPWHGPWVGRWAGQDTDLFYVFTKFYTDLVCRILPDDPSVEERLVAPGWVLVQAQVLSVLDSTMQRVNNQPSNDQPGLSPVTFDEMLGEADASATVLPLPANSAIRSMAENRMILLLRDCLSGSSTIMTGTAQSTFAHNFSTALKAAARKISVFDHNACFALCDFLEEALAILTRFYQASGAVTAAIDWTFWLEVCKHMLQSHNSMTEVRLCAFLYAMWPTITSDANRRGEVCLNWLLKEEIFQTQFNHWCPMVRAFFMRLLAWRVARVDGNTPDLDTSILDALVQRLQNSWRHFLYLQKVAAKAPVAMASTPAPGRRLLIIRNDVQPAPAGMFLSFDGILSSSSTLKVNPYQRHSSVDTFSRGNPSQLAKNVDARGASSDGNKKRWSLFRNIMPISNGPKNLFKADLSLHQDDTKDPRKDSKASVANRMGPTSAYRNLSFKFSLEWFDRESQPGGTERQLLSPQLPLFAHLALSSYPARCAVDSPLKPEGVAVGSSRYAGRALAEWDLLLVECRNFFERRKAEGVPSYEMVETPTLGVEPFRKS